MKFLNIKHLLLLLLAASLLVVSCKKDDDDPQPTNQNPNPTDLAIVIGEATTSTSSRVAPGGAITIAFTARKASQGKNLSGILVEYSMNGGPFNALSNYTATGLDVAEYNRTLTLTAKTAGAQKEAYRLTATDLDGKSTTQLLVYTIDANTSSDDIESRIIDKFEKDFMSFSTFNWTSYMPQIGEENKAIVDISYFFSETSGNNLVSPAARTDSNIYGAHALNWGVISTEFRTTNLTAEQYEAIRTGTQIVEAFNAGRPTEVTGGTPNGTRITGVEADGKGGQFRAGNIIAFKSGVDNKCGLMKIDRIAADVNGNAAIYFKKQK